MHDNARPHVDRYVPFKAGGWGVALLVVLLAGAFAGWATYVHNRTYKHPTDVHFQAAGSGGSGASHE